MTGASTSQARALPREQTEAERKLWAGLRGRQVGGLKFRRQYPIDRYFADFCCIEAKLVVELDGSQHADRTDYDVGRTQVLEACGFHVLRFWNGEIVDNLDGVLETILNEASLASGADPHPPVRSAAGPLPLPQGEVKWTAPHMFPGREGRAPAPSDVAR